MPPPRIGDSARSIEKQQTSFNQVLFKLVKLHNIGREATCF